MTRMRCDACGYTWTPAVSVTASPDDDERAEGNDDEDSHEALPEEDTSAVCPSCGAEVHSTH